MERAGEPFGSRRDAKVDLAPARFLVLAYLGVILCGALLLALPQAVRDGEALPFIDALFTAASAVCVTGLTVVDPAAELSLFGQLVLLTLIQVGAVGILTISTFFLLLLGRRVRLVVAVPACVDRELPPEDEPVLRRGPGVVRRR